MLILVQISAAQVYRYASMLVALWEVKARYANGRPFDAISDVFNCVSDMVNGAAFAIEDNLSATRHQMKFTAALEVRVSRRKKTAPSISRERPSSQHLWPSID